MYFSISVVFLLAGHGVYALCSNASAPHVDLGYVKYQGFHNATLDLDYYYGIYFAAPPTGQSRWRAAVPIERQNNYTGKLLDATKPGVQCMQRPLDAEGLGFLKLLSTVPGLAEAEGAFLTPRNNSEDCLLLDVIVSSKPKSKALPVVIQIHGGGYTTGNSLTSDGSQFVTYSKGGVIWVQIQYRLDLYGFLGAKEVLKNGDANIGITDQRVAFDWVQRNIHHFGGDPTKVTIWGGSAGGGSVMNHLIIDPEKPSVPFRAAIAEFPWWQPYHDQPVLETQYQQLLNVSKCQNLDCLRNLSEAELFNATQQTYALAYASGSFGTGDDYWGPYVDGKIIRDLPSNEFKQGRFHKVPLLTDHNAFESVALGVAYGVNATDIETTDLKMLWPAANQSFFTRLYQLYPLKDFINSYFDQPFFSSQLYQTVSKAIPDLQISANDTVYWRTQAMFADSVINCPTYYMATAMADAGQKVWKLICNAGIYVHGAAGVYTLANSTVSGNATLANFMKDWFLSFVSELDPNVMAGMSNVTRPEWPQYQLAGSDASQFNVMRIEDTNVAVIPDSDASDRCDFYHSESYVVRN